MTRALSQSQVMMNQQQLQDYQGHISQVTQTTDPKVWL